MANQQPPVMLTARDLLYIEDILNVSQVYYKKAQHFAALTSDQQARKKLLEFSKMLTCHYDEFLTILQRQGGDNKWNDGK